MAQKEWKHREAALHCYDCGHGFKGQGLYVRTVSDEGGASPWIQETNGAKGNTCPHCESELIGFAHD